MVPQLLVDSPPAGRSAGEDLSPEPHGRMTRTCWKMITVNVPDESLEHLQTRGGGVARMRI